MKNLKISAVIIFTFFLFIQTQAQQVSLKPFALDQSNVINDLKNIRITNPKMAAEDFVKSANDLLAKQGLNFTVGFDSDTCQKIDKIKKTQKIPNAPLNLRATLKSPLGDSAALLLPETDFAKNECFPCFITLPFLEVTDKDFVTIIGGNNLKFSLPGNFLVNEVFLVDAKDFTTVKSKWKIPFKSVPLSVSDDGNILFTGFNEPELNDLALAIFSEGNYQFYAKKDIDISKKAVVWKDNPVKTTAPNFAFIKFVSDEKEQIIKYAANCPN